MHSVRFGGGIGRHAGLKIPWAAMPVRVRFPSEAHQPLSGEFPRGVFVSSEMLLIPPAGHKISKNVSKWRLRTRFEHEIGENVSESVVNGHFKHEIGENMRESSNYSIPLDAECTSI